MIVQALQQQLGQHGIEQGQHARAETVSAVMEAQWAVLRALQAATQASWIELDLTMAQWKTIIVLADEGPLTVNQVAEALRVSQPTASHLVERLVRAGLAERTDDPADRRRAMVQLSTAGNDLRRELRAGSDNQFRAWLEQLDEGDLEALLRGLRALERVADTPGHSAPVG